MPLELFGGYQVATQSSAPCSFSNTTMNDTKIIAAMKLYGSTFEKALAEACMAADSMNLWVIKGAFPELWQEYSKIADTYEYQRQYCGEPIYTKEQSKISVEDISKCSPLGYRLEPPEEPVV